LHVYTLLEARRGGECETVDFVSSVYTTFQ
jgi:hypothetical protein